MEIDKGFRVLREELTQILDHIVEKFEGYILGVKKEDIFTETHKQIWITWALFLTTLGLLVTVFRQKGFIPLTWLTGSSYTLIQKKQHHHQDETKEFESFTKELVNRDKYLVLDKKNFQSDELLINEHSETCSLNNAKQPSQLFSSDKPSDMMMMTASSSHSNDGDDDEKNLENYQNCRKKKKKVAVYVLHEDTI